MLGRGACRDGVYSDAGRYADGWYDGWNAWYADRAFDPSDCFEADRGTDVS